MRENILHRNMKLTVYILTATITNAYVVNLTQHEEFSVKRKTYNLPMQKYHFSSREKKRSQVYKLNSKPHRTKKPWLIIIYVVLIKVIKGIVQKPKHY